MWPPDRGSFMWRSSSTPSPDASSGGASPGRHMQALHDRGPVHGSGLVHHSDRGVQGGFKWSSQQDLLGYRSTRQTDPHLLTVKHAIWRRSFSTVLVAQPLTSIAPCLVSSRTSRRCAPVPQAASWTRPARGALPEAGRLRGMALLSHQGMQFRSLGSGWATSEAIPNTVSSGRRLTWPISAIGQAPLPAFAK